MDVKVGRVSHYYNRISVAVLELTGDLEVGDRIVILGKTSELTQVVTSMEIDHRKVQSVSPGMDVALKVAERVRRGDIVYKMVDTE